jgi:hypothetical protein
MDEIYLFGSSQNVGRECRLRDQPRAGISVRHGAICIQAPSGAFVQITSLAGRLLYRARIDGTGPFVIPAPLVPRGVLLVTLTNGSDRMTRIVHPATSMWR